MANTEQTKPIWEATLLVGSGLLLYYLTFASFSKHASREIKRRSRGICEECGGKARGKRSVAAHVDHNHENPNYNLPMNGRHRCRVCEAKVHLQYAFEPESLGLSAREASTAAWGRYTQLTRSERQELPESLTPIIEKLRQMYQKGRSTI